MVVFEGGASESESESESLDSWGAACFAGGTTFALFGGATGLIVVGSASESESESSEVGCSVPGTTFAEDVLALFWEAICLAVFEGDVSESESESESESSESLKVTCFAAGTAFAGVICFVGRGALSELPSEGLSASSSSSLSDGGARFAGADFTRVALDFSSSSSEELSSEDFSAFLAFFT